MYVFWRVGLLCCAPVCSLLQHTRTPTGGLISRQVGSTIELGYQTLTQTHNYAAMLQAAICHVPPAALNMMIAHSPVTHTHTHTKVNSLQLPQLLYALAASAAYRSLAFNRSRALLLHARHSYYADDGIDKPSLLVFTSYDPLMTQIHSIICISISIQ